MEEEIWKPIIGYEWMYEISNMWRVKTLYFWKEKIRKNCISKELYAMVWLKINKLEKKISVHRLVAIAFIPNPENKEQVNHINWIRTDNRVENLEWCTGSENCLHKYRVLWSKNPMFWKPSAMRWVIWNKHHSSKKISQYSKDWEFIREWDSATIASIWTLIKRWNISSCCTWKLKSAWWYIWRFD